MIDGLLYMDSQDLAEVSSWAGLDPKTVEGCETREELLQHILAWMAEVVGSKSEDQLAIERDVVEWTARAWKIDAGSSDSTSDIEKRLRVAIADESSKQLAPFWEVGCAMALVGPEEAMGPKLQLMEAASSRLIPSSSARKNLSASWQQKRRPEGSWEDVLESLQDDIEILKADPGISESSLALSLVVALSDGRFGSEEEFFYAALAERLGIQSSQAGDIQTRVNTQYWENEHALRSSKGPAAGEDAHAQKYRALKAAHLTLESSGILGAVTDEVQSGFLGQLHRTMTEDPSFKKGVAEWNKTPLMLPLDTPPECVTTLRIVCAEKSIQN